MQRHVFRRGQGNSVEGAKFISLVLLLIGLLSPPGTRPSAAQNSPKSQDQQKQPAEGPTQLPRFTEEDATRVLDDLLQALEAGSQIRLLEMFDAQKMPNYPLFRDQVTEFFEKYESFDVRYHLLQAAREGDHGVVLVDFVIDLVPTDPTAPHVHKQAQLRLVLSSKGKQWKIVDLSPRGLFS